jgi:dTDP-4-amino-4,6-dideoxygalactose transaminase
MFARHGALKKHQHEMEGINSRLDAMQAAILNTKLPHILNWTNSRINNAKLYDSLLINIPQIEIPKVRHNVKHSYHLYVIKTDNRDELASYLKQNGVNTAIHYPIALHNMNAYKYLNYTRSNFPNASFNEKKILSLPMFPELSKKQIIYISDLIKTFFTK